MRSSSAAETAERELVRGGTVCGEVEPSSLALDGITIPLPVFFCSVEPASAVVQGGESGGMVGGASGGLEQRPASGR